MTGFRTYITGATQEPSMETVHPTLLRVVAMYGETTTLGDPEELENGISRWKPDNRESCFVYLTSSRWKLERDGCMSSSETKRWRRQSQELCVRYFYRLLSLFFSFVWFSGVWFGFIYSPGDPTQSTAYTRQVIYHWTTLPTLLSLLWKLRKVRLRYLQSVNG